MMDGFVRVGRFNINLNLIRRFGNEYLSGLLSTLKHELIHSKINVLFGVNKSCIRVWCRETNTFIFLYGVCTPIQKIIPLFLFLLDLFHFIYDIIYDIICLNLSYISEDVLDYVKFNIESLKKNLDRKYGNIINER